MFKISILFYFLLIWSIDSTAQNGCDAVKLIREVDSIFTEIKNKKNDHVILYYPDGAIKYGIILWTKENVSYGIAFRKNSKSFLVKNVSEKNIKKSELLTQFSDSINFLINYQPKNLYHISHDFKLLWIYTSNDKTDIVTRLMSEIISGNDYLGKDLFLKFEKLFDLSISH